MTRLLLLFQFIITTSILTAQTALIPASFEKRVAGSVLIVEGYVSHKESFKSYINNRILTKNKIIVTKILKGDIKKPEIILITQGGELEKEKMTCEELLSLSKGDKGIFFCIDSKNDPGNGHYDAYTEKQAYLSYSDDLQTAYDLFTGIHQITEAIMKLETLIGLPAKITGELPSLISSSRSVLPEITSFSPIELSAGTNTVLTITGTGFGEFQGKGSVQFKNSDNGGNTYMEPELVQYKSWSDTEIQVEVPSDAGTGKFRVRVDNNFALSPQNLTVRFSRVQVEYQSKVYSPVFVDDMAGGYPWHMYEAFAADSLASESFLRAFKKWRCISGVNWFIGSDTDLDQTDKDNMNIIRFDNGDELPENVLGICYSYYEACTENQWYIIEYDIIFDKDARWQFDQASPSTEEYDFESVAFHELGHGHQLGHVINSNDVMHFAISSGSMQRDPIPDNLEAAKLVVSQSSKDICQFEAMKQITPDVCDDSYFAYFENLPPELYPNPFNEMIHISYFLSEDNDDVEILIYDLTGRVMKQVFDGPQKRGEHTIALNMTGSGVSDGIYIVRANINNQEYSRKIISVK